MIPCKMLLYIIFICSIIASTSSLPDVVDLENCLHEERLSSEKLSKLFEVPPAPVSSPILKKSHSDGIVELSLCYHGYHWHTLSRQSCCSK